MKKYFNLVICTLVAAVCALGFTACTKTGNKESVKLVAISGEQVGVMDGVDYYVVAEPAASAKVNAIGSLKFVGDLQQLYGGGNGYPQAIIVAKNELADTSFIGLFMDAVGRNREWLLNENTSSERIVNAVNEYLTDGMSPVFTAKNLTKDVIRNCGINLTYASADASEIQEFMDKLNSVSDTPFGTPNVEFFHGGNYGTAEYSGKVSVYVPNGAPALGIANLLAGEEPLPCEVDYEVVDASLIQTYVTGNSPKADICVLPVNLAVKLLGGGEKYKLLGTLTHGNLYMVSDNAAEITIGNFDLLKGKTVGVVNLSAVPGLTFKLLLKNNGIEYEEIV